MNLLVAKNVATDLLDRLKFRDSMDEGEFLAWTEQLIDVFEAELKTKRLFMLKSQRAEFYNNDGIILEEKAIIRFSQLRRDAIEAGNCFALARYTACVFHLMRIAEFMNQQFAKELGITAIATKKGPVSIEDADWRIIHDHINNHINGTKNNRPMSDKDLREKCNNLLSLVGPLREVRNPLMHSPGDFYTEENAETYIKCVSSFIRQFCEVFPA